MPKPPEFRNKPWPPPNHRLSVCTLWAWVPGGVCVHREPLLLPTTVARSHLKVSRPIWEKFSNIQEKFDQFHNTKNWVSVQTAPEKTNNIVLKDFFCSHFWVLLQNFRPPGNSATASQFFGIIVRCVHCEPGCQGNVRTPWTHHRYSFKYLQ